MFLRQIDMSDVTEVSGVMEAAGMLQLDPITTFCAERLLKKDTADVFIQTTNEGQSSDMSQCEVVDNVVVAIIKTNASPLAEHDDIAKEAGYQSMNATPAAGSGNDAPHNGYTEGRKRVKQSVETSVIGKYRMITDIYRRISYVAVTYICST